MTDRLPISNRGRSRVPEWEELVAIVSESVVKDIRDMPDPYEEALAEFQRAAEAYDRAITEWVKANTPGRMQDAIGAVKDEYWRSLGRLVQTWNAPGRWADGGVPTDPCPACGAPRETEGVDDTP